MDDLAASVLELVLDLLPARVSVWIVGCIGGISAATSWLAGNPESAVRQAAVVAAWVVFPVGGLVLLVVLGRRGPPSHESSVSTRSG